MTGIAGPVQWRQAVAQLCKDAGYESPVLLQLVDAYEQLAADYSALLAERERWKLEAAAAQKPRLEAGASHMSSKLWDAIHE